MFIAYTGIEYSGRTTVILNMACLLAKEGHKVLVVDADQTKSQLSALLNLNHNNCGLQEAVTSLDESCFDDCFIYDKKTAITYLTLPKTARYDDLFLLTFDQAENFYQKAKRQFEYILIDCGNICYEPLSAVSLFEADKVFVVLPPEKRAGIWSESAKKLLNNILEVEYIAVNLHESPEIPLEQAFQKKPFVELPYILNMRDYTAVGQIFVQNPTGKKALAYVNAIEDLVDIVKEP